MDDTLLTKRRLVKMSGYFVKLFIFLYFYETKTKSINYKKQKKKNKMIIKNTSQYAPDPLNRPSKYKPPPGGLVLGNCPEIQKKTKKTVNFLPRIRLAQSILKRPPYIRDLSEIRRGGGGWKQREGHNFLSLQKREGS